MSVSSRATIVSAVVRSFLARVSGRASLGLAQDLQADQAGLYPQAVLAGRGSAGATAAHCCSWW